MTKVELTLRARRLRVDQTGVEGLLWSKLRNRQLGGWKWKRQVPRGRYIVDFICIEAGVVVELDGFQHAEQENYDAARTKLLQACGLQVLRFWNIEVLENLDGVCDTILSACGGEAPSPYPLPKGRGMNAG